MKQIAPAWGKQAGADLKCPRKGASDVCDYYLSSEAKGRPIPIIPAFRLERTRQMIFWCPYCRHWHAHGQSPSGVIAGTHRLSHCFSERSPHFRHDYYLADAGPVPDWMLDRFHASRNPWPRPRKPPEPPVSRLHG